MIIVLVGVVVVVVVVVESGEPGELDESGISDEYGESGLKKENCLLQKKINDDADRPTNQPTRRI